MAVLFGQLLLLAGVGLLACGEAPSGAASPFAVQPEPAYRQLAPIGLNLGSWTSWGAEQLCANVLKNPGFEGVIDRCLVVVSRSGRYTFADDAGWLGRPDGFWAGASFDVRSGAAAGQIGLIADSRQAGAGGMPEFSAREVLPELAPGDVVALTRVSDAELPSQWWFPDQTAGGVAPRAGQVRPGSPGHRSLALSPQPGRPQNVFSYLDAIGERAGKLLPVQGEWRCSLWSRLEQGSAALEVEFGRQGSPAFLKERVQPGPEWVQHTWTFRAEDTGPAGILALRISGVGGAGRILIDDVYLGAAGGEHTAFRPEVVQVLKHLRPGYLRDWMGQLGDTGENRLAPPFGRRAWRSRPGGLETAEFGYSLPEFLDLCTRVGSRPWVVVPTTYADTELVELGRYLASRWASDHYPEIVVEFGNENWNPLFRPAGIPDPVTHGEVAERAFRCLREGAGSGAPLKMVVNGQHANPENALRFLSQAPAADLLAVAPYFQPALEAGLPVGQRVAGLFAGDGGRMKELASQVGDRRRELAVYEVNLHTTGGKAAAAERDPLTAGAAAGSALAKVLLQDLDLGVGRQCVYVLAGYDAWLEDRSGFVKLWASPATWELRAGCAHPAWPWRC